MEGCGRFLATYTLRVSVSFDSAAITEEANPGRGVFLPSAEELLIFLNFKNILKFSRIYDIIFLLVIYPVFSNFVEISNVIQKWEFVRLFSSYLCDVEFCIYKDDE